MSIAEIKKNVNFAQELWDEFENELREMAHINEIDHFRKHFHLRPTGSYITIVSVLDCLRMRGVSVTKTKLKDVLNKIYKIHQLKGNSDEIKTDLIDIGFKEKTKLSTKFLEEQYQVKMISGMGDNASLKEKLKVNNLKFLASEFILHEGKTGKRYRVDIIGYDGDKRLFFFELKRSKNPSGKGDAQVEEYVKIYGRQKRKDMMDVLTHYPINAIRSDVSLDDIVIEGYAVWGYGDEIESFFKAEGLKKEGDRFTGNKAGKIVFSE